ncbi:MAG: OmpA family protein [Deltaproteobacteria bacterium]|nr:OmpA family protein [Deltaproteobacteria bacterium]
MSSTLVFRAKTTRVTSVIGGVVALLIASAVLVGSGGCTNAGLMKSQADDLSRELEQLKAQQAERCAPREMATAESNLDFFDEEYAERDYWEAQDALAVAKENAKKAQEQLVSCADRDHDGILDVDDLCPDDPETVNGYRDEDGCPDAVPSAPAPLVSGPVDFHVRQSVYFDTAKHVLTPESQHIVREAVRQIREDPHMMLVAEGNTDSVGSDASNQRLSIDRAKAVKAELVAAGIDPGRIEVVGFGETRPIATNATPDGRAQNRRVDLRSK